MQLHRAVLVVLLLAAAVPAAAQDGVDVERRVDVDRLPLDLNRIQRELRQSTEHVTRDGLNLRYVLQIYGAAPRLELFTKEDNLVNGPVPYGGPTHRQMLEVMTPQEFRAPIMDFSALMRWLADRNKKK
jgi:hypothetical protein